MAFGQQSGPPASSRQVNELLSLLHDAGHSDFRDARGPMGFTQRQAAGRFTHDEAAAFIEQLHEAGAAGAVPDAPPSAARSEAGPSALDQAMRHLPTAQLAAELRRRGWLVLEP